MMDLSKLEIKNEGERLYLTHPGTGERLEYGDEGNVQETEVETVDVSTIEDEEVQDIEVREKKYMYLVLMSHDSEVYKKKSREIVNKRIQDQRKNPKYILPPERVDAESDELLAAVTVGGKLFMDGKEIDVNSKNIIPIYSKYLWIREQAENFVHDRSNFL